MRHQKSAKVRFAQNPNKYFKFLFSNIVLRNFEEPVKQSTAGNVTDRMMYNIKSRIIMLNRTNSETSARLRLMIIFEIISTKRSLIRIYPFDL